MNIQFILKYVNNVHLIKLRCRKIKKMLRISFDIHIPKF